MTAQRNNVLTNDELRLAFASDPRNQVTKTQSVWGTGVTSAVKKLFRATWTDAVGKRVDKLFATAEKATAYLSEQLKLIESQQAICIQRSAIVGNADGVAIILTNKKRGENQHIQVDDDVYDELNTHNWNFTADHAWSTTTYFKKTN